MKVTDDQRNRAMDDKGRLQELTIPYCFTGLPSRRKISIKVGDVVGISGLSKSYRLIEIFPEYRSVRVQELDERRGTFMYLPWKFLKPRPRKPMMRSKSLTQALGDALYRGSLVYHVGQPDRVLRVRRINWNEESSWVEDDDGKLFKLDWDDTEFWEN